MRVSRTTAAVGTAFGAAALVHRWQKADAATRTPADAAMTMPGDGLVPDAGVVLDRATTLPAPASVVWPWLVQLGKGRAGWYLPRSVERVIPPGRRALRHIDPALLRHDVGDRIPDWGPGTPVLQLEAVEPEHALVYLSLRDRGDGHRWPKDPDSPAVLRISWVLVLDDLHDSRSRLHLRLRAASQGSVLKHLADPFDAATVFGLFAGLRERLAETG